MALTNKTNKSILYVSYDGMTDSLGQSQVIPYLTVLSKNGYDIHILSAEKPEAYAKRKDFIGKLLSGNNIQWHPVPYTKKPPIVSTVKDVFRMKKEARRLHKQYNFNIITKHLKIVVLKIYIIIFRQQQVV